MLFNSFLLGKTVLVYFIAAVVAVPALVVVVVVVVVADVVVVDRLFLICLFVFCPYCGYEAIIVDLSRHQ